ncbi:MAG: hypothetical protein Q8L81_16405 [Bacteroidota bacterium]|nr:hypothetical protein [Bacteroidota bacterium]
MRIISISLMLLVALNALVAGYLFISDPSGSKLQIPVTWLQHSPFKDFLIPGIVLFTVNGILNIVAAIFAIFKWKNWPKMIYIQGLLLTSWIIIQIIMLQDLNFLHYILAGIGILLMFLGWQLNKTKTLN